MTKRTILDKIENAVVKAGVAMMGGHVINEKGETPKHQYDPITNAFDYLVDKTKEMIHWERK